jgi:formylglycine-generating enzyme required for sulfatase activity
MGVNPAKFNPKNGGSLDHPVEQVSWFEAVEYCKRLGQLEAERKAGRTYRLPTEAEWEYACRAGSSSAYSFGDNPKDLGHHAWYDGNSGGRTHPVGALQPNRWGLYDMHGNVMEWCSDYFNESYYRSSPMTDPPGSIQGPGRIARGGSWAIFPESWRYYRSAARHSGEPGVRFLHVGFRVVMLAPR